MPTYKFNADNRYFNPTCDSELLYNDLDGDTERIFCTQSTCIAPLFTPTGVPVPCDLHMKPSGYTSHKFEWGLEGGPWTLDANYSGFTYLNNQFLKPFQFDGPVAPTDDCMLLQKWYFEDQWRLGLYPNPKAWGTTLSLKTPDKVGYQPMEGQELVGTTINPSVVGSKIYSAGSINSSEYGCTDSLTFVEPPEISYFTVGTDEVPDSNVVTFPRAPIAVDSLVNQPFGGTNPYAYFRSIGGYAKEWGYIQPYPELTGITPNCSIQAGAVTSIPSGYYSTDRNNLIAYRNNPYNFDPSIGACSQLVKYSYVEVNGTTVSNNNFHTSCNNITIITGYRMQKYIQKYHTVYFSDRKPQIRSGVRHLETIMYALGYYVTWEMVSITPQEVITLMSYPSTWFNGLVNYNFSCRGEVKVRINYTAKTPSPLYSTNGFKKLPIIEYGPYAANNPPEATCNQPIANYRNVSTRNVQYNPPWGQWGCYTPPSSYYYGYQDPLSGLGSPTHALASASSSYASCGFACGYYVYGWSQNVTHVSPTTGYMTGRLLSDPLHPRSLKSILSYKFPLNWVRRGTTNIPPATFPMLTVLNQSIPIPQAAHPILPGTPNNFKLWRRKIGDLNTSPTMTGLTFKFTNRKEWFNGACPFDVKYDNIESDLIYHPTSCSSTIKPYASSGAYYF